MSARRSVQLPTETYGELNQMKIRLAGSTGEIPTLAEVVKAAMKVASDHYDETLAALMEGNPDE